MYILTKIGLIILVVGIALAVIGLYEIFSFASQLAPALELKGATKIVLGPYQNYTIPVSPYPGQFLIFAYNYTSPISSTLPPSFTQSTSPITNENVYLSTNGDVSGVITLHNPTNSSVEVYYVLDHMPIPSLAIYAGAMLLLGGLLFIVGLILTIVGIIVGRRKRS